MRWGLCAWRSTGRGWQEGLALAQRQLSQAGGTDSIPLRIGVGQQPFSQILFVHYVLVIEKRISGDSRSMSPLLMPVGLSGCEDLATLTMTGSPREEISVGRLSQNRGMMSRRAGVCAWVERPDYPQGQGLG